MRKFFVLCLTIFLLFFTLLAADVDLRPNLTFTFEPTATTEKSLIIIPFTELDFSLDQTDKVKKDESLPIVFGIGVVLVTAFCLSQAL